MLILIIKNPPIPSKITDHVGISLIKIYPKFQSKISNITTAKYLFLILINQKWLMTENFE
jgi:hypothetical protein